MINARPHINGNRPENFRAVGRRLSLASEELDKVLVRMREETFHGRNYQHLEPGEAEQARSDDLVTLHALVSLVEIAKRLSTDIYRKGVET